MPQDQSGTMMKFVAFLMSLLHSCYLANGILDPVDFLALQAIRKSLVDLPGSHFFDSWDFTSDPCSFAGVHCAGGDRVIALNLGDPKADSPGLTGHLHPDIAELSGLTEFTVVPGKIYGPLPESLSALKHLRFLGISRNFISGEIPACLGQLKELRTLDLGFNQLSGAIPSAVAALPALSTVILNHNRLSGSVPVFVSGSLTRFDVRHNDLSGTLPPDAFPQSLQFLSLSWNRLSGPVDRILTGLTNLNYLDLSMNRFNGGIPGSIFNFPITNLQLQRNNFSGRVTPAGHVTIPTVDLSYNHLYGEISPLFSTVQNLYINNNRFTGEVPVVFVDRLLSASIQLLYLQHNFLTGIQINPAADIPATTSLCLLYNCMVPPIETTCPEKAGKQKSRPTNQCTLWEGETGN
ncbi:unnamed protein product [Cuscuta campestris]|uniref:Leucine-rich repeat-containing N-terminal plant-type domain-containing protein n=1 Tax=Cuscuta campestris TaxID=132261 RepID=A0A484K9R8_9ASTE|nr:unnamed protein product [Cuscuta campestris]